MPDQQKYLNKLAGKRVLVLGGSSGIGYGVAEACLENDCKVFISSSKIQRVQAAVEKLQNAYPSRKDSIKGFACDLGSTDVEANIVKLIESTGDLDHVVHTAGDNLAIMRLQDVTLEALKAAGQVRFFAAILLAKHLPASVQSLTLTSGGVAQRPHLNWSPVAGFASGLQGLTRNLALDLAPVRVNLVLPGIVDTDLWANMTEDQKKGMYAAMAEKLPTRKVGTVENVAEGYLAIMKDGNCTGSEWSTNGGGLLI